MAENNEDMITETQDFPDVSYQRNEIQQGLREPMVLDQDWYLIDAKWFKTFKNFVGLNNTNQESTAVNPGPIDNFLLLDDSKTRLRSNLVENLDYVTIPKVVWNLLLQWYGLIDDQSPIERKVVNIARSPKQDLKVEIYKVLLKLFCGPSQTNCVMQEFSCSNTILDVEDCCRKIFKVPEDKKIRLRCWYSSHHSQLLCSDSLICEESLDENLNIVMEIIPDPQTQPLTGFAKPQLPKSKEPSKIPRVIPSTSKGTPKQGVVTRQTDCYSYLNTAEGRGPPCPPGLSGLMNLGNTCFLNSIIQCLSNCGPITQYFQEGRHTSEINPTNPFGRAGAIANTFADVIAMIWSGRHSITVPHQFKLQLTRFAPQFAGSQQHDAQELLTFLLDGLHEDLNRVNEKPYTPSEDTDKGEDDELSKKSWENFQKRNDSVIVDNFHGMLKSRVVCPKCEKVSVKFDTFSTLSLPLPLRNERTFMVRLVPYNQTVEEVILNVKVPKTGTVSDMVSVIGRMIGVPSETLILTEIERHHFHRFFALDDLLETISDRDELYVYDLPQDLMDDPFYNYTILPVVLWEIDDLNYSAHIRNSLFGTPFLLFLRQGKMLYPNLYDQICERTIRNCEHFMDTNPRNTFDSYFMDYRCGSESKKSAVDSPFTPVMVNSFCYSVRRIDDNDESFLEIPATFGREFMALKVPKDVCQAHYTEQSPITFNYNSKPRKESYEKIVSLEDCLNVFISSEKLGENNAWHCPYCATLQKATKKLDLWKLPNILIFHLKRFVFNETRRDKLGSKVIYPMYGLSIDHLVANKHKENLVYDLIGVCNHYGSLMGGHYTAYCKNYRDGNWYCFDDTAVTKISPELVQSEHAYLLFYQRRAPNQDGPEQGTSSKENIKKMETATDDLYDI